MILSVVIVSYNVKFFLEQCLSSVKKAIGEGSQLWGQTEVFVVDNASTDGTVQFLQPLFPGFYFIQNTENTGFARANNQVAGLCSGEYLLFLNPDTILAEDNLENCISFFHTKPDAGAVGVRMVDGAGRFLRESKRGFPGILASFFKMTGFTRVFPRSKIFSTYYMGHLDERNSHAVEILSGAYLMTKKDIFIKSGGFDEQFFMYGEDIDLSYRIRQQGYQNYYVADTTIIHFKGESTRRDLHHVKMFYGAMILFMKKHFKGFGSSVRLFLLTMAVRSHQAMAYMFTLNHKKEETTLMHGLTTIVRGDPESQEKWKRWLSEQNIPVAADGEEEEVVFCEGPSLSWKEIIKDISDHPDGFIYLFHGKNTHAAVSSYSSRLRGEVFVI
jgi:N-acetylglucosaminyl-diphospho-decaprenol L-rhamnosyltransferase